MRYVTTWMVKGFRAGGAEACNSSDKGMTRVEKPSLLGGTPLFSGLPSADLRRLERIAAIRSCRKGQMIFVEREAGDTLYVVESGSVKIFRTTPEGDETVLDIMGPGDMFGEMAVLGDGRRSASAVCLLDSRLWQIGRESFLALLGHRPELSLRIISLLSQRLDRANRRLEDLTYSDARQRILACLRDLAAQHGRPTDDGRIQINLRLTHQTLAQLAGTARETVSRVLVDLQESGALVLEAGRLRLTSLAALSSAGALSTGVKPSWLQPPPRRRPRRGPRRPVPEHGRTASARNGSA